MEKKVHFSKILMFTEKIVIIVLIGDVRIKLAKHQFLIEQVFFAQNAKNNKVDRFNLPIYTI